MFSAHFLALQEPGNEWRGGPYISKLGKIALGLIFGGFLIFGETVSAASKAKLERIARQDENAYTATVLNGTDFCTSAEDAACILGKNPTSIVANNCFSDFMIFLGKVFVTCFTVFGGLMAFNYHRELHVWAVPLMLVAFLAYLIAHSFMSVIQTIVDVLFLCFMIDRETNDGSLEKPYFMDPELMNLFYQHNKLTRENTQRNKGIHSSDEYGTELQPMTRT